VIQINLKFILSLRCVFSGCTVTSRPSCTLKLKTNGCSMVTMISTKRRHQYALSFTPDSFTHTLLHPPPFEKDLVSLNQNLYLSPFLSLSLGCFRNFVNCKFSLTLDDLLLGFGGPLYCNRWNPWSEAGRE